MKKLKNVLRLLKNSCTASFVITLLSFFAGNNNLIFGFIVIWIVLFFVLLYLSQEKFEVRNVSI